MILKTRGARLALVTLALCSEVLLAQQMPGTGQELRFDSNNNNGQSNQSPPIQSPTIVTPQGTPGADKVFSQTPQSASERQSQQRDQQREQARERTRPHAPLQRNEFQEFVLRATGHDLPLFGYNLFEEELSTFAPLDRVPVPADYVIGPGDEILIRAWGQIDVDVRATVDRNGRIYLPKVGAINVASTRYQDLDARVRSSVARVFKNFDLVVTLGELRSIQVFVVGQVRKPGGYTVGSLSTLVNALLVSGGPTSKGSLRKVQLKRGNKVVSEFDFYDLLLKGDKSKDAQLLPGDVIFVPSIGPLVAISGSVNVAAIYELQKNQKLEELLAMAGGLSTSAAGQKVTLERIFDRKNRVVEELSLDATGMSRVLADGDMVNVFTLSPRLVNAVTLRGNVATPLRFEWKEDLHISDIIPDRSMLVVPDYWMQRNRAGRPQSWIAESTEAKGDGAAKVTRDIKRPGAEVNWDYAVVERLSPTDYSTILIPFNLASAIADKTSEHNIKLEPGDIVTIFSKEDIRGPQAKQSKFVRLEGEMQTAGVYQIEPGETLRQLLLRVGGTTPKAYIYGAEFTRESTRQQQQERLNETLGRLEVEMQRSSIRRAQGAVEVDQAQALRAQDQAQSQLLAKLRQVRATGRIVLEVKPEAKSLKDLPDLVLEDGDHLLVPSKPSTVSVFGSVYNQNAYIFQQGKNVSDYLSQAGGPTKDADKSSLYVVRADGSVVSRQQSGWFSRGFNNERLSAGDAIIVPEDLDKFSWTREVKDWTQIFYQFALGVAGLKVLKDL
jgi:polysaccharide export outer membrane protein